MSHTKSQIPSYEDVAACQHAIFEWAESFDSKDWSRLARCVAPTLHIDYTTIMDHKWPSMPAADFIAMVSSEGFIGSRKIQTQHFIGASTWTRTGENEITGHHQMRVAHQKYKDDDLTEVLYHGHAHGKTKTFYRQDEDGVWKWAGLVPEIRWTEGEYGKIFQKEE